ncbi:hypothetical protein LTR65_008922 [Meristemomyces frigidus]
MMDRTYDYPSQNAYPADYTPPPSQPSPRSAAYHAYHEQTDLSETTSTHAQSGSAATSTTVLERFHHDYAAQLLHASHAGECRTLRHGQDTEIDQLMQQIAKHAEKEREVVVRTRTRAAENAAGAAFIGNQVYTFTAAFAAAIVFLTVVMLAVSHVLTKLL